MPSGVFEPSSNFLADCSSVVLLLWILIVICISCLFPILYCLFLEALWSPAGRGWPLVCGVFFFGVFVTFTYGVLGQVWYLIVWVPDLCFLPFFP